MLTCLSLGPSKGDPMPKINLDAITPFTGSRYPAPYASQMGQRSFVALGDAAGLTQFGAVLVTLEPGATSSLRHWHTDEDELVYVLSGDLVLVENEGETPLTAGEAAGFKAGEENGHHLQNRSEAPAQYLCIGTRAQNDTAFYSDVDLMLRTAGGQSRFALKNGRPAD